MKPCMYLMLVCTSPTKILPNENYEISYETIFLLPGFFIIKPTVKSKVLSNHVSCLFKKLHIEGITT